MKHIVTIIAIYLSVIMLTNNSFATDYTSKQDGNSGRWSDHNRWQPKGVPGSDDNVTIASGTNITIDDNVSCINLTINAGGMLQYNSGMTLTLLGNFSNSGTYNQGTGTLNINGPNTQTIGGSLNTFYNLTINNSAGVIMSSNVNVNNTLSMTSGNIITGAYILTLGTSTSNLGTLTYNSGQIITDSTGGFRRWFAKSTVSNVYFPVGSNNTINMITLSFTSAPTSGGTLKAKFVPVDPRNYSSIALNDAVYTVDTYSQRGYWQIDTANGITGGTYSIFLRGQGFNPLGNEITNYPHLRVLKRSIIGNSWSILGSHTDATQYSNNDPVLKRTGLSGFSQFAVGGSSTDGNPLQGPMPVELTSFTANTIDRDVKLNWITATETNNSGFEILRSSQNDKNNWTKVGFIAGNGTKNTPTTYTFEDKKLETGKYNYRLKQIDYNGNYEYFNLTSDVVIGIPKKLELSQNYPNPFNPVTKIDYQVTDESKVTLKIYDITGKEVMTLVNTQQKSGYYTVQFNASNLSSGNYFYKLIASSNGNESVITKKMTVIK